MRNGMFTTLKTTEYHKEGNECSLSDILEDDPDPKYYLTQTQLETMVFL